MAILTEGSIKRLLRTTELKETKHLVLEPGTVITPSAKEYLKNISIEYAEIPEIPDIEETKKEEAALPITPKMRLKENEPKVSKNIEEVLLFKSGNGQKMWKSHFTYQFKIKIDIATSHILSLQRRSYSIGKTELTEALNTILMLIKTMSRETLTSDKLNLVQEIDKLLEEKKPYFACLYPEGSFIPTYKDEECAIDLFEIYAYLEEIEHLIAKEMKEVLAFEDYINRISIAGILKDYCWILMAQSKENSAGQG